MANPEHHKDIIDYLNEHPRAIRSLTRGILYWAEHLTRTSVEGEENLKEAADHVNRGEGGLIVIANHNSYADALFMKKVRDKISLKKKFEVLWANKFKNEGEATLAEAGKEDNRKVKLAGKVGMEAAELIGIDLVDVPQITEDFSAARKALYFIRDKAKEVLGGKNVLGVFPEGTRSRDGALHKPKRAMEMMFKDDGTNKVVLIFPIAAIGTGDLLSPDKEKLHPLAKVKIIYGKAFSYAQAQTEMKKYNLPIEDIMMWHIGMNLPRKMWGECTETFDHILEVDSLESKKV